MAKVNKALEWRLQGMIAALKIAKEKGIDGLENEVRTRNVFKIDLWARKDDVDKLNDFLSKNLYQSMLSTILFTIHDTFGFGKERLHRLKKEFDKNVGNIFNLDYFGEHYVRFEDYAVYLNNEYGFEFDAERISMLQDLQDEKDSRLGKCDLKSVVQLLKENGYKDAGKWLEKRAFDNPDLLEVE